MIPLTKQIIITKFLKKNKFKMQQKNLNEKLLKGLIINDTNKIIDWKLYLFSVYFLELYMRTAFSFWKKER